MRICLILWTLAISISLFGQNDSNELLEPDLILADIDTLISTLISVHPTFKDHYEINNIDDQIQGIKKQINAPMSSLDLFRIMQPIITIDGHTSLIYTGAICPGVENPLFPFRIIIHDHRLVIKENLSENKSLAKGSIIESINGIPAQTIIDNLIRYRPGEKLDFKTKSLESQFHMFLVLVYGSFAEFELRVNGKDWRLKGAKWADFEPSPEPKFELRFYDDDIAYIYKRMFMPPRDFLHFMDSAFTAISERDIKYLIIDNIRGGGMSDLSDSLMSYFSDEPYCMMEKQKTKISPFTQSFIHERESEGYTQEDYFIQEYPLHIPARSNRFTGSTYILSGPLSYSAATCFSAAAKCYHAAYVVGEESGQPLASNGGQHRFTLPNTSMDCMTSLSVIYMPCNTATPERGVLPDYEVKPTLEDQLNDTEYILDYTLELIRQDKLKK